MNMNSSIISAMAYIIITTAVITTIDAVFMNITNIPASSDIVDTISTTIQDLIPIPFNFKDILIFINPVYAIQIPIMIRTIVANVLECVIIIIPNNIAIIP